MISQSSPLDAGRPGAMPAGRAVVAAVAIVAAIAATCALGAWQLRRAAGKEALQQRFEAAAHAPPVEPDAAALREPRLLVDRHVRFAGRWRPDGVVYLDNRPLAGVSGFEVLMPLAIDGPRPVDVIVDRGWVPRDPHDRQRIASYRTPDGPVAVDGVALADAPRLLELGKPAERRLGGIWQNFDFDAYARASGSLPLRLVVRQDAGGLADGLTREGADRGGALQAQIDRHHGYAFQWFGLAAALAAFLVYRIARVIRHGRLAPR